MKKLVLVALLIILVLSIVGPAFAHRTGPCNDSNGDGVFSGQEYAQHHIVEFAHAGRLGDGGHKPGAHHGFSVCNPSGS